MVELLPHYPPYVAAYKASGKVDHEEYERIVMKRVNEVVEQYGSLNFLVRLETGMQNYSLKALADYLLISFKHLTRWNRMAIVTDQRTIRLFYDLLSPLVPGRVKGFPLADYERAREWVSAPELRDENHSHRVPSDVVAGAIGTTTMTTFSYLAAAIRKKNFSEPLLLARHLGLSAAGGWILHYAVGAAWALLYGEARSDQHPRLSALIFGAFSGSTAIVLWRLLFLLGQRPVRTKLREYFMQLFAAHFVYALTVEGTSLNRLRELYLRRRRVQTMIKQRGDVA